MNARRRLLWLAASLALTAPAGAANLVQNSHFHVNTAGWTTPAGFASSTAVNRSPLDGQGVPTSGSLRLRNTRTTPFGTARVVQCVPVEGGSTVLIFNRYFVPAGQQSTTAFVAKTFTPYPTADCSGPELSQPSVGLEKEPRNAWREETRSFFFLPGEAQSLLLGFNVNNGEGGGTFEILIDDVVVLPSGSCTPTATNLCLNEDRFLVAADWHIPSGEQGAGQAEEITPNTGYFWFFSPVNVEEVIKVHNACAFPGAPRYWVLAGGLTNVQVVTLVVDTAEGILRTYPNPLNTPFAPLQDTSAFATCP